MLLIQISTVYSSTTFTITQIGGFGQAVAINNRGQIVGSQSIPFVEQRAFLWTANDGMQDLGTLPGTVGSYATDINEKCQVVGTTTAEIPNPAGGTSFVQYHAFMWTLKGGIVDLGTPEGFDVTSAYAINNKGEVVGNAYQYIITAEGEIEFGNSRAFLWTADEGFQLLGTLGGPWSSVRDINNRGQAVGFSHAEGGDIFAFLWTAKDGMQSIGTPSGKFSIAMGINNKGAVVGRSDISGDTRAFLWTAKDGFIHLPTLGGDDADAWSVNDRSQVVGTSVTDIGDTHAFLWTAKDGMQDLGTFDGYSNSAAFDINNRRQIVGYSGFFGTPILWEP